MANSAGDLTREKLVLVAERLFAERGIDAVSLREIGELAGQRNTAAIQYHFGGRDGLMRAIFDYRAHAIGARRNDLMEKAVTSTAPGERERLRQLVEALVLPLAEQVGIGHYVGYIARLHTDH